MKNIWGKEKEKGFFPFCFLFKYNLDDLLNLPNYQVNIYKEAKQSITNIVGEGAPQPCFQLPNKKMQ